MGGRCVGPEVEHEVFAREEPPEHARPGYYTRSVIIAPQTVRDGAQTTPSYLTPNQGPQRGQEPLRGRSKGSSRAVYAWI